MAPLTDAHRDKLGELLRADIDWRTGDEFIRAFDEEVASDRTQTLFDLAARRELAGDLEE